MIRIARGVEPIALRKARRARLAELVRISKTRTPVSDELTGYAVVATDLWHAQKYKCCYCERKIPMAYHDVEHYRPKGSSDRRPGCSITHGYWWLAYTWSNLLFACQACNRTAKNDKFPLDVGSVSLDPLKSPPGRERALLLDPAQDNGVEHIEFVFFSLPPSVPSGKMAAGGGHARKRWMPRARGGSPKGDFSIRVYGLGSSEYLELYDDHVNTMVRPAADDLNRAVQQSQAVPAAFHRAMRLLQPQMPYIALSYDALRTLVPNACLVPWNLAWPPPEQVGCPVRDT